MRLQRDWITPLTIGSFVLLTVTGVLMFFHLDSGLNKLAHEWLSWVLVAAVAGHIVVNLPSFKRYFKAPRGRLILAASVVVLGLSFVPLGDAGGPPPFVAPIKQLAQAPVPVLAQVAGVSPQQMRERLQAAGLSVSADSDTVAALAGPDLRRQMQLLGQVLAPSQGR